MKKGIIIWILLAVLFPTTAFCTVYTGSCGRVEAYPKVDSTNLMWRLNTSTRKLIITGAGKMRDYDSDTPAPWHQYRNYFDTIWVSDSATSIGEYAFWDLRADSIHIGTSVIEVRSSAMSSSDFKSLIFPTATQYIRSNACNYNSHLRNVIFQNGTRIIEYEGFSHCNSLRTVNFGSSNVELGSFSFYDCSRLRTISGTRVKRIEYDAFWSDGALYNVSLGDSLQYIGDEAFGNCDSLTMFVVPAATTQIGRNPFASCSSLDSLSVVSGNTHYDSRNHCNAILHTSSNYLISGCVNTIIPTNCVQISEAAFQGCNRLDTITIPNSVRTIGSTAFESCSSLRYVTLSDSVNTVGCYAFNNCSSLQAPIYNNHLFARLPRNYHGIYTMPSGIRTITCGACYYCEYLTSVVLPQSLREIESEAFSYCQMLDTITIPSSVNQMESYAFEHCYNLTRITMPDSITTISYGLFYDCSHLRSIIIPDAVSSISGEAFSNCQRLQHVTIPANLQTIGTPFYGCDSLSSITWNARDCRWDEWSLRYYSIDEAINSRSYQYTAFYPVRHRIRTFVFGDSVQVVPRFLCYEMDNLTSLTLPCNIDSIERCAFDYCYSVDSITWNPRQCNSQISYIYSPFFTFRSNVTQFTFGDSVQTIPAYLCHGMSSLHQLHIPASVRNIGPYAFRYLNQLDTIWVDSANSYYDSRNHCNALMKTNNDSLMVGCWKTNIQANTQAIAPYAFRNVRRLTNVVIPEGVTFVGEEAFNGCRDLDSVVLPLGLTAINDYTFQDCDSLRYLRMPDSLRTVGLRAFANCYSLPTLTLAETLHSIDDYAFSNCTGLLDIYCNPINPPIITDNSFEGSTCPIYVPCESVNDYRSATNWSNISSRINGQYFITFDARPNDYSYGDVIIVQEPSCANSAIVREQPVVGYEFVRWINQRGETVSTDSIFEFIPVENTVLTGVFQRQADPVYDITLIVRPDDATHGSTRIVVQPNFDILAEVDATPAAHYAFRAWTTEDGDTITYQKDFTFDPATIYYDDRDTVVMIAIFERTSGIDNASEEQQLHVWADHKTVFVEAPDDDIYYLYNINGLIVDSARGGAGEVLKMNATTSGIYLVKSKRYCVKVVTK